MGVRERCYLLRSRKGLLFTLDSIFALFVALVILTSVIFALKTITVDDWSKNNINELSMDYLTVLEESGRLRNAIDYSGTTEIKVFLNIVVSENICAKLKIYDSSDNIVLSEVKTGCGFSNSVSLTKRSFVAEGEFYYAVLEAWYHE